MASLVGFLGLIVLLGYVATLRSIVATERARREPETPKLRVIDGGKE